MPFCVDCGTVLVSKFCGSCGRAENHSPTYEPSPANVPAPVTAAACSSLSSLSSLSAPSNLSSLPGNIMNMEATEFLVSRAELESRREEFNEQKLKQSADIKNKQLALALMKQEAADKQAEFERDWRANELMYDKASRDALNAEKMAESNYNHKRKREKEEKASDPAQIEKSMEQIKNNKFLDEAQKEKLLRIKTAELMKAFEGIS